MNEITEEVFSDFKKAVIYLDLCLEAITALKDQNKLGLRELQRIQFATDLINKGSERIKKIKS